MDIAYFLSVVVAIDLLLNFFFHLVQLQKYCNDEVRKGYSRIIDRIDKLDVRGSDRECKLQRSIEELEQLVKKDDDEVKGRLVKAEAIQ